jgi:hypothetical protein
VDNRADFGVPRSVFCEYASLNFDVLFFQTLRFGLEADTNSQLVGARGGLVRIYTSLPIAFRPVLCRVGSAQCLTYIARHKTQIGVLSSLGESRDHS